MLYYGGIIQMPFTNLYSYSAKNLEDLVESLIVTESVKSRNYNVPYPLFEGLNKTRFNGPNSSSPKS